MYFLISKNTRDIDAEWDKLPRRIRIPNSGDVMFSPTAPADVGPEHVLREAAVTGFEPFDPATQIRTGPVTAVAPDFSATATYSVRAKTQAELDADKRGEDLAGLRDAGKDLALVLTELVAWLVANTAMQATDFTPGVRLAYQDLKAVADRVKAP